MTAAVLAALMPGCTSTPEFADPEGTLNVGFLMLDGVYNSELMAPYDIFQHTVFHTEPAMRVFTVGRTHATVTTFEGLRIEPDFSLADAPRIDVLVVPSAEHNMDSDLEDVELIDWVRARGTGAQWLLSVCDGAFVLAAAGLLDGATCTTFPGDRDALAERFPEVEVRRDVLFAVDGKSITGVGGARSYEPAFWLVEHLYGPKVVAGVGRGMVVDWDASKVPHVITNLVTNAGRD